MLYTSTRYTQFIFYRSNSLTLDTSIECQISSQKQKINPKQKKTLSNQNAPQKKDIHMFDYLGQVYFFVFSFFHRILRTFDTILLDPQCHFTGVLTRQASKRGDKFVLGLHTGTTNVTTTTGSSLGYTSSSSSCCCRSCGN
jgi:hypothetical protein